VSRPLLVAAAMGIELRALARRLGRSRRMRRSPFDARLAQLGGNAIILVRTGIGRRRTAENLEAAIEQFSPLRILHIGMAGALSGELEVGDPCVVSSARLWPGPSDTLSLERAAELEEVHQRVGEALLRELECGRRVHRARLLTVDEFVNTSREKRRLGTAGFDLVDMEFAAAATLAAQRGLELTGLKVVSDSLLQSFPSFRYSVAKGARGIPPPRLVANAVRACRTLGRFALAWLQRAISAGDAGL